eukprot:8681360-Prorocentrum_lima.AAC.1
MPCSASIVRRPRRAGTSLLSSTDPSDERSPNPSMPMGTLAFVLTAFEDPPTPQTVLRPGCSRTTVSLPA